MTTPKVELRKDDRRTDPIASGGTSRKINSGGFEVFVDGEHWGRITTDSLGSGGLKYYLNQIDEGRSCRASVEESSSFRPGRMQQVYFYEYSDKLYQRNLKPDEKPVPLADRLEALVREGIARKALRDPKAVKAERIAANERLRQREAREAQEREATWNRKADEVIGAAKHALSASAVADLKGRIVAGMKWAQGQ